MILVPKPLNFLTEFDGQRIEHIAITIGTRENDHTEFHASDLGDKDNRSGSGETAAVLNPQHGK